MQIEALQRFVEIVNAGSFYQAAKRSNTTAQGYAKTLNSLEGELGVVLTTRSRRGIQLTPEGVVFLKFATDTVTNFASSMAVIDSLASAASRTTPATTVHATQYLMQLVSMFYNDYGLISRFRWREESFDKIALRLANPDPNDIYVADVYSDEAFRALDEAGIVATPYFRTVMGVLVRADSPLAGQQQVPRQVIAHMPLCLRPQRERNNHRALMFDDAPLDNVVVESEGIQVLLEFVRENPLHGCLTDSYMVHSMRRSGMDISDLSFVSLAEKEASSFACLLHAKTCPPSAQVLRVLDLFRDLPSAQLERYMEQYPLVP